MARCTRWPRSVSGAAVALALVAGNLAAFVPGPAPVEAAASARPACTIDASFVAFVDHLLGRGYDPAVAVLMAASAAPPPEVIGPSLDPGVARGAALRTTGPQCDQP